MLTNPRDLFRMAAAAEAITWTLLVIGMVLKYVTRTTELGVRVFGMVHGVVFIAYCLVALAVWVDHRWPLRTGVLAIASAFPPWATLWFERWVERPGHGGLRETWRLGEGGEPARSRPERVLAWSLRHPVTAIVVALVLVGVVTAGLLAVGPPVPKD